MSIYAMTPKITDPAVLADRAAEYLNDVGMTEDEWVQQLMEDQMEDDGGCETLDGCWVEPDGYCMHCYPSWLLYLGLI